MPEVSEKLITDAWDWYVGLKNQDPTLVKGTYVLMEMMQKVCRIVATCTTFRLTGF